MEKSIKNTKLAIAVFLMLFLLVASVYLIIPLFCNIPSENIKYIKKKYKKYNIICCANSKSYFLNPNNIIIKDENFIIDNLNKYYRSQQCYLVKNKREGIVGINNKIKKVIIYDAWSLEEPLWIPLNKLIIKQHLFFINNHLCLLPQDVDWFKEK